MGVASRMGWSTLDMVDSPSLAERKGETQAKGEAQERLADCAQFHFIASLRVGRFSGLNGSIVIGGLLIEQVWVRLCCSDGAETLLPPC